MEFSAFLVVMVEIKCQICQKCRDSSKAYAQWNEHFCSKKCHAIRREFYETERQRKEAEELARIEKNGGFIYHRADDVGGPSMG